MDGHLARPALLRAGDNRAGERPHRAARSSSTPARRRSRSRTQYRQLRMWRNTAVDVADPRPEPDASAPDTLGYEWDEDPDNGFRPPGQIRLSSTTVSGVEVFTDYGSTTELGGTATHNLTMYRVPSGARVFGAGTVQWAWGLDDWITSDIVGEHDDAPGDGQPVRRHGRAAVDAAAAASGRRAQRRTARRPPRRSPRRRAASRTGAQITITGTAADGGGGVVAGVEVSTDNGATWHPATTGTTNWSYTWTAHGAPIGDDQGARHRRQRQPRLRERRHHGRRLLPLLALGQPRHAAGADAGDPSPVEVGRRSSSPTGSARSRASASTSRRPTRAPTVGSLWTAGRAAARPGHVHRRDARAGWQTVTFANPVEVTPDTTYVASYFAPNGHYSATARRTSTARRRRARTAARSPTARRCTRIRNVGTTDQRRLLLRRHQHVPDQLATAPPTTGSTCASRRSRRPAP